VASLYEEQPLIVDVTEPVPVKRILPSAPRRPKVDGEVVNEKHAAQDAKQATTVSIFTASGDHILTGTSKGWLNIIDTTSRQTIYSNKICSGLVSFMRLTGSGNDLVLNATDRIIRTIKLPNLSLENLDQDQIFLEVEHKFQDVVNRLSWNHVAFSATGEFVTASTYNNHDIYIWERSMGSLVKILEGPKEEHGVIEWHPHRPLIAACGLESGRIHLWSVISPQRWSALAPDFVEVEENVDFVEYEDDFDIHPQEEIHKRQLNLENEDVDVLTIEPVKGTMAEHEDDFHMPVLLDVDETESEEEFITVGTGTMRRKSPGDGREYLNDAEIAGSSDEKIQQKKLATTKGSARNRKR
jgi:COMPASS component SWD1